MKKIFFTLGIFAATLSFAQQYAKGYVFEDTNNNGKKDRKEKGIPNISVSNGSDVVTSDQNGFYSIPVQDDNIIFVIKPSGYSTKIKENQLPEFYYIHKPQGSPKNFKYKGVEPTGPLPKEINFPLNKQKEDNQFQILVFGDPQPYNQKEVDYFRRGIINEVKNNKKQAVFGITLGDLVGDNLNLHPEYIASVQELKLPWYNVMGNHDMNYEAKEDQHADETFESHFGPANYAFNYGKVHFIILDDILYPDPRDGKSYWGGFREDQLTFVENDLKNTPKDHLVVVAFHIQMNPEKVGENTFRLEDRQRLFDALKPFSNVLMMSAHTHKQSQIFYTKKDGWEGQKDLHEYNVGTTSGDWYSGTIDEIGVPKSIMRDGTYRGYSYIDFDGNQYKIKYKTAGKPEDFQISLHLPKAIPFSLKTSANIVANFFMGSKKDELFYRIDNGKWEKMKYTETFDPNYTHSVLEWDYTPELMQGRRPNNPDESRHLWSVGFPRNLEKGKHTVEVKVTDRYGNTFTAKEDFSVEDVKIIP